MTAIRLTIVGARVVLTAVHLAVADGGFVLATVRLTMVRLTMVRLTIVRLSMVDARVVLTMVQ